MLYCCRVFNKHSCDEQGHRIWRKGSGEIRIGQESFAGVKNK